MDSKRELEFIISGISFNFVEDISMNNKINIENIDGEELIYTIS